MSTSTPHRDLWPDDLGAIGVLPPVAILREQGELLAKKTKGLVEGCVVSRPERGRAASPFMHEFFLRVPAFGDYRFGLFDVRHDFEFYPLSIRFSPTDEELIANSEEDFLERLRELFSRPETRQIIDALLAQVQQ